MIRRGAVLDNELVMDSPREHLLKDPNPYTVFMS